MNIDRLSESGNTRSYDSPTRRAQAAETRPQIADAACALFVERGWAGTRVRDVAAAAGVSEPTVYAVYGSKAGLATALLDSLSGAADFPRHLAEVKAAEGDPRPQLAALVAIDREIFEHGADAITVIREAGRSNPDLAPVYAAGRQQGEQARTRLFGGWPAESGGPASRRSRRWTRPRRCSPWTSTSSSPASAAGRPTRCRAGGPTPWRSCSSGMPAHGPLI